MGKEIDQEQNAEKRTGHITRATHFSLSLHFFICKMRGLTKMYVTSLEVALPEDALQRLHLGNFLLFLTETH